ncbi:UNVERIFIED_CONTAM: hypothetical protein BEN50_16610 [Euhalothece sp. KZN 001]
MFKEFFRGFVHRAIFRIFLDNMNMKYFIMKDYSCNPKIHGKFLDNILYRGVIRKISVFFPIGIDYPENVGMISI